MFVLFRATQVETLNYAPLLSNFVERFFLLFPCRCSIITSRTAKQRTTLWAAIYVVCCSQYAFHIRIRAEHFAAFCPYYFLYTDLTQNPSKAVRGFARVGVYVPFIYRILRQLSSSSCGSGAHTDSGSRKRRIRCRHLRSPAWNCSGLLPNLPDRNALNILRIKIRSGC